MKRVPMKRTAWPRRNPVPFVSERNQAEPGMNMSLSAIRSVAVMARVSPAPAPAIQKENAVRSEEYRRLVAALPCRNCGIVGYSQAAHLPPDGKGIKQDDRQIFALCCARVGITGCHADFDQYRLFTRTAAMTVGLAWAADTRRQITAMGQWPANLERLENE